MGTATVIETLEVYWPTSRTTQTFRDVPVNRFLELTEFADAYKTVERTGFKLGGMPVMHGHGGERE